MLNRLSPRCFCTAAPRPWLFVGLGNPGGKYKGTRHNAGFEMIDVVASLQGIAMNMVHCKAIFGQGIPWKFDIAGFVGEVPVFLAKPQTYMNLSGEPIGPPAAYYKLSLNSVLVAEECDLSLLREQRIPRLRIGIRRLPGQMDPKAFLLQKFNATAQGRIDDALQEGVDILKVVLSKGFAESARRFNLEQKYKHLRLETLPT